MCVRTCECNHCYKKKTCADCEHVPDHPNCSVGGVQGCSHRISPPSSANENYTMTRAEMIAFIKENHYVHITHPLFVDDEYIYAADDGNVYDENDYLFENWDSVTDIWSGANGIRMRTGDHWENGWTIKK